MIDLKKYRQYFFLIKQMNDRDSKKKLQGTEFGRVWNILNPFIFMIILSTYYQNVGLHKIENYPVFVFVGIMFMNYYRESTMGLMKCLVNNKRFLVVTKLPREIFVYQKIVETIKEFLYSAIAFVLICQFFRINFSWRVIVIIPVFFLTTIIVIGVGEVLSYIFIKFPDIEHLYSLLMTMMLFVSGIFLTIDSMPKALQNILTYNPIFLSIYMARNSVMYNLPSHYTAWLKLCMWAIISAYLGRIALRKGNVALQKEL
jgi:lipopolysaccharide transport system permease protein